ncbi:UDP-N-acetylglucosamine 2-epimerase (hydrolyzing) [Paenibacillus antri]|uniref:UDP-N-acetylglucosamine 2-epimerase (Hydrolyzing) n=1 Tax=Paenibacillus antri TaxID=2582848 RepID=A0A5R9GB26_9BACL|nr:UDP-N-acetylglucosamine 2-epimerase [Paenibacillus antri]TLS50578.1 UDP-N-acetylglucosamine 2-epimerase (hydrolyzing) [Paenibacillus antri]
MTLRSICAITGTRADFGILKPVLEAIQSQPEWELHLVATGAHLSPEFGNTARDIEREGFRIDAKVDMLLSGDSPVAVTKSIGLATIGFADVFARLQPDLVLILGDRYEMLAAAQAALIATIPIAHIAGGDISEGAYDDAIRHSITKMSHLHFTTNPASTRRVVQMGERPETVITVGSPAIDTILKLPLLSKPELEQSLGGFTFRERNVIVTFHPATLETDPPEKQFAELLEALDKLGPGVGIIFTFPNADTFGRELIRQTEAFVADRLNARAYPSLGQLRYFSAIRYVDAVVGNSSSGLYEVPSFGKPTVNIGNRQKGRLHAESVLHCRADADDIYDTILKAMNTDASGVINPYGDGNSVGRIVEALKRCPEPKSLIQKSFYEVSIDE